MTEFPSLVYKDKGNQQRAGGSYSYLLVEDKKQYDSAIADGWFPNLLEAIAPPKELPPTRAELDAKATELGIKFDGRMSDKTIADKIAENLKA